MKIKSIIRGFTLIELLVVITIIGILATGAVTVYTSQIQKSRDSVRLTDIKAVQGSLEQFYQDNSEYPDITITTIPKAFSGILIYMNNLPQDPKSGQSRTLSAFDYLYNSSSDSNGVDLQEYEISTTFEQNGNITKKAANIIDGGDDDERLEFGINVNDTLSKATVVTALIDSGVLKYECVTSAGGSKATCSATNPMVIRK